MFKKKASRIIKKIKNYLINTAYRVLYKKQKITLQQIFDTETITRYQHVSITLRYLYIESYFSSDKTGIELYKNAHKNYYRYVNKFYDEEKDINEFNALIESIKEKGYDSNSVMYIDKNGNLYNGAHRMAICAYFGIKDLYAYIVDKDSNPLTPEECYKIYNIDGLDSILLRKYSSIREKIL